ncbi:MAG TPA: type II toxin-antitoxin system VapC family toxin [Methylomirabilota bacterium]|nr:type II toxin-antitoxin system VapC family toxin [Methylomirabilota bacterium]
MYTLDTNVIIYYQKRDPCAVPVLREILGNPTSSIYVSTVTEAELFSYPTLSDEEKDVIESLLQSVSLIPPISQVARITGTLRAPYGLKLADAFIAATALFTGSTLLTRNVRDFKKIPSLKLQAI